MNIIFIAGAPGTGKSTIAKLLQEKMKSPCFEFGWIPEFRHKNLSTEISYMEEESIAFENLVLVLKNYVKHKFTNIIVTDLEDKRILELHKHFKKNNYILITLIMNDDKTLKSRILNKTRSSKYRNWKSAIQINNSIKKRALLPKETRIDITKKSRQTVLKEFLKII